MVSRHAPKPPAAVNPLTVICPICAAEVNKLCRDITAASLVIKKNKTKRAREMFTDLPLRSPHEARIMAANAPGSALGGKHD